MRAARPDLAVTTTHTYVISYKFNWRCADAGCAYTIGRHSNSIDPNKHCCARCANTLLRYDPHST